MTAARWLVTGAGGMLGADLVEVLAGGGRPFTAAGHDALDVTDSRAAGAAVAGHDVVVNTAAYTDVDGAETHEAEAMAVNRDGVAVLAAACREHSARLLHVSTDYVFAGDAAEPYPEEAPVAPASVYGRSKAAGERALLTALPDAGYVVRTAWLYGEHGRSFVATMLRLAAERDTVDVVADQRGQPTWSHALALQLVALGEAALAGSAAPGVYHGTAAGETTWYELARTVYTFSGLDPDRIQPVTSDRFPRPARRPASSVLGHARWAAAGLAPLAPWRDMVAGALERPAFLSLRLAAAARSIPDGR